MNKKGFTLIEVLAVVIIIGILGGIAVIAVRSVLKTGDKKYYNNLENNMLLAAHDYFTDHRDKLPFDNYVNFVELAVLESEKYIEEIKDVKGNKCTTGRVYVYRENNQYAYEACLTCGEYHSVGKYCDGGLSNKIYMIAKTNDTHQDYDILTTYNSTLYVSENVDVTFSMDNKKAVKYTAVNTKTNVSKSCDANSNPPYTVDIDESGTYKVTAYDDKDNIIATNQYFNVRIAKNGPKFNIDGPDKTIMTKIESKCNGSIIPKKAVTYKIVKDNINDEYKTIEYKVDNGILKTTDELTIPLELESGKHKLTIIITNFAGEASIQEKEFDISFMMDLKYSDSSQVNNDNQLKEFEVVSGQKYNYLHEKYDSIILPTSKKSYGNQTLEIRWHPSNVEYTESVRILGNTTVDYTCTNELEGLMSIPVDKPSNWATYCKTLTYNGSNQVLTNAAPTHIEFLNNKGKDAKEYTITAHIDEPRYIWKNEWTFEDKTFECSINQKEISVTANAQSKTYGSNNPTLSYNVNGVVSGETAAFSGSLATNAEKCSGVGNYDITKGTLALKNNGSFKASNYSLSYTKATLSIGKKSISVKAADKEKYKTQANPTLTYTSSGSVCNQTIAFSGSLSTDATASSDIGSYDIKQNTLALKDSGSFKVSNYSLSYTKGTLVIKDPCAEKKTVKECGNYGSCSESWACLSGTKTRSCIDYYYSTLVNNYKCGVAKEKYNESKSCKGSKTCPTYVYGAGYKTREKCMAKKNCPDGCKNDYGTIYWICNDSQSAPKHGDSNNGRYCYCGKT